MAIVAAHLGTVNEADIDNMSFVFFEDVLQELNYKLTYEAVSNYAGNGFCEKSWDLIMDHHPMILKEHGAHTGSAALNQLANLFGGQGPMKSRK